VSSRTVRATQGNLSRKTKKGRGRGGERKRKEKKRKEKKRKEKKRKEKKRKENHYSKITKCQRKWKEMQFATINTRTHI
jgi:hypothetical protein